MKLSIYCGVRSVGWIITDGNEVIKTGIKRLNVDSDTYYEFIAGNTISKRVNRRLKRTARRNASRRKSRRKELKSFLTDNDMMPTKEQLSFDKNQRYMNRYNASMRKVDKKLLGLALIDLQAKRGYKSMRGVMSEGSDYLDAIKRHEEAASQYPCLAAYMLSLESDKDVIFTRESYENEFFLICEKQGLPKSTITKLHKIIYFQRPLKKGSVGRCKLENNRTVAHKSHPLFQEFRCYRDANNINIVTPDMKELEIPKELRLKWADKLLKGNSLTKASCCKDLGIKKSTAYTWLSGKKLEGNTAVILEGYTEDTFKLWHNLYSATDEQGLYAQLLKVGKYTDEQIQDLMDIDFKSQGWADVSIKAVRKLLPELKEGHTLKEAILNVYGKVDFSSQVTLRNLVVEQVYDSCKSLVDEIYKNYDISILQVELDPMLKQSNKARKSKQGNKRKGLKWEKENQQVVSKAGGEVNSYNYSKLKLWEEWEGYSPYEPDKKIPLEELFSDKYNIDHIVPKSLIFERGAINQCLSTKELNEKKGATTAIEFVRELGIEDAYRTLISSLNLSDRKRALLYMSKEEIPKDYLNNIAGNDYNTRCFMTLHKNSICIPNKLVFRYVKQWKFDKYKEDDARAVLMKALVVANMSKETVEYFGNLKDLGTESVGRYNIEPSITDVELPNIYMPSDKVYRLINGTYSPRVQLHKETIHGQRKELRRNAKGEIEEIIFYKVRKPIMSLTKPMIAKVTGNRERAILTKMLDKYGSIDKVLEHIAENPIMHNGKAVKSVSVRYNLNLLPLHSTDGKGNTANKDANTRKIDFVANTGSAIFGVKKVDGKIKETAVPYLKYIDGLNKGVRYDFEQFYRKGDTVEYKNKLYVVACSGFPFEIRPIYQLNADKGVRVGKTMCEEVKVVRINQLGDVTKN